MEFQLGALLEKGSMERLKGKSGTKEEKKKKERTQNEPARCDGAEAVVFAI